MGTTLHQRLTALAHACALALAGFMLMGSLAVIGAHQQQERVSEIAPAEASRESAR